MDLLVLFYLIFTVVLIRYTVAKTRRPKGFFISGMLVLIIGFACLFYPCHRTRRRTFRNRHSWCCGTRHFLLNWRQFAIY
ncbi:hypothetical protein [Shouchella miscanthi]|uniref:Uncharacterized protein n=1 Tax=Shouchella miscanthi TaxID=2598861 RepID=A0ABU6NPL9_9BACI|nr:hypothetical protein [Shouchella miscanthi]